MPSSMPTLDDQFPTLKGDESPKEMFLAIVNYLFVMKESLDYTLANLSADNWNSTAWDEMTEDAKAPLEKLEKQLTYLAGVVSQVNNELLTQKITVGDLSEDMGNTKDRVTALEDRAATAESDAQYLLEQVAEQEGAIADTKDRMTELEGNVAGLSEQAVAQGISIGDLTRDMGNTKDRVAALEDRMGEAESDAECLLEQVSTQAGQLEKALERLQKLESRITITESGATTIGKENTALNLVGEVSINGVPYEEGTE